MLVVSGYFPTSPESLSAFSILPFQMKKGFRTTGICLFFALVQAMAATATDTLLSQAQMLYSQGNFEEAAKVYGSFCLQLSSKEKRTCQFNEIKALIESKKTDILPSIEEKLLVILSLTEPGDSLFAELSAEDAKLQVMLGQPARAIRSWNAAQVSANVGFFSELFVLCRDIISAYPEHGLTIENCNKIKPGDTTLISLPRKTVVPLTTTVSKATAPQASAPKAQAAVPQTAVPQSRWYVQLGAFGSRENAEKLVADFKSKGVLLYIVGLTDRNLFAVRTGFFGNADDAKNYAEQKIASEQKDYKIFKE